MAMAASGNDLAALILRSATDFAIITSDRDGIITSWSPGAENVLGWTAAEAIGQSVALFFTPDDVAADRVGIEMTCARAEGMASDERWHMKADGSRFWAGGEMQPLMDGGRVVGFVKILRDRTEQYELGERLSAAQREAADTAERLAAETRRLHEMFAAAPGFIAVFGGRDLAFDFFNASYQRLVGGRAVVGRTLLDALPELEGQGYLEKLQRAFDTDVALTEHAQPVMLRRDANADPELRFVDYVFQPMHDPSGVVTGLFLEGFDVTDAVAARAAADKIAAEQSAILGQLAEGVIATDADGRITFVNAAAERLHGVASLHVAPDDYSDTYHLLTEDGAPYPALDLPLARAVAHGETVTEARWRIRRPNGSEVLAIGNAQPVVADGVQVGAVLTVRDDTARAEAEGALDESRSYLRLLLDSTGEGFYSVDTAGVTQLCNAAFLGMLGFEREEQVVGRAVHDLIHHSHPDGSHYPAVECPIYRCAVTGASAHVVDEVFFRLDGTSFPVDYRVAPILRDGKLRGAICTFTDQSEQRLAEQALRTSEMRSHDVLEGMTEGFLTMDRDLVILSINAEGLRIDGRPRGEIVGRHLLEVWPESKRLPNWTLFNAALADGRPRSIEYRHVSGMHDVWLETRIYPIETGLAVFYRDVTTRKAAEEALADRERQFRELADNIPTLCWTARADGGIYWYNRRWYDYTGTTPESQAGWGWESVQHPDWIDRVVKRWTASIEAGRPFEMTFPLKGADGEYRHFLTRIEPIRGEPTPEDPQGPVLRWFGTNTDVEDQRVAQAAAQDSDERYRLLFDAIDAGFCVLEVRFDEDGRADDYRMVEVNPAFERQTGLADPAGKWISELAPDIEQHWKDLYGRVARTRTSERREQGSEALGRWFDVYAFPIDALGSDRVAVLFNDITERKNAELRLTELNRTLESRVADTVAERDMIWRTSQDLFVVTGLDGVYRSVNPAWTATLGWEPAELIGALAGRFIHPDDVEYARTELSRLADGIVVDNLDLRMVHKDGGARWISWTCVPQGEIFYASGRDVTQRKELEDQLRQSQKMEAVGQLTGGIAHDFNNLLTIVSGNIDMAKRSLGADGDARALRSLGNAAKGADRAAALTQRLLAFSRRQPLQPRATDVNKLVTGMTELLDRALGETVALQVVAAAGLWRVEVDPNQLENAILNLAVNARDAMAGDVKPGGGKLTIETTNSAIDDAYAASHAEVAPGQYVLISVTDTGEGMPPEIVAKAFDPFFSTKEVGKGTGLGLSQVYGYVKQSGGHVAIYSEAGHGTTIKLYLPRLIAEMNAGEEEEPDVLPAMQGQETILVVEDDDDVRIYTVDSLRELGYRVLEAHDGASALRLLERQDEPVKLLLTDVVMPGMSGRELADRARLAWPDMQILFTTGYARNAIVHGGRLDAGVELLPKPFTYEALAAKVREVLEKVGLERALILDPSADAREATAAAMTVLGFASDPAATVREALGKLRAAGGMYDVVVMSDTLPVGNLDAVVAELHAVRAALPLLILSLDKSETLKAQYASKPCVGAMATPIDAELLKEELTALKVKCARSI